MKQDLIQKCPADAPHWMKEQRQRSPKLSMNFLMEKNPAIYATVPKAESKKREIWDAPTLFHALEVCEDERLKLAINLSFACSLRIGELLGLTWDCVDVSPESIAEGKAYVFVNKELIRKYDLPEVVFHSLRHSSITYKLKLNGGDIKAVQGDSGHAQATMVTDQYSHILDDDRKANAELFENAFYSGKVTETSAVPETADPEPEESGVDPGLVMKLLSNPDMASLLKTLAQSIK